MKKSVKNMGIIIILTLLLAACGEDNYEASEVNEDVDTCEVCNMMVPNNQHATQIVLEDGRSLMFDDLGCLYKWKLDNQDGSVGAEFVRDFHTEEWIEIQNSFFVYDKDIMTPMAYNIISFKEESDAKTFIETEGKGVLIAADNLDTHHWERNKEMMEKNKEMMNHDHNEE
ncbi:nitrous oxide reductase accessory protein NosL [Oceanobacillus halophilus]|uniref:Nitrous oxide reductase accessory protein NosL n=1 Tax=Oceanobacillus halophilus TaxID=930130 RepID=A0A495A280_9BACI|nr:nitrous oxide reductase accessory protein NosL [Oceanobacillus halophilus]RKQ33192.1 hypothetical protein D8M06_10465 [Oceanobacillus halophilus]